MIEMILPVGIGVGLFLGGLLFYKFKKPMKLENPLVNKKEFAKGEGPIIQYDIGLGGSPYRGRVTNIEENGENANITFLTEANEEKTLYNLNTTEGGNLKLWSSIRDLLHGNIEFLCNKDSTNEIKSLPDGSIWSYKLRTDSSLLSSLLARRRAEAKALRIHEDLKQYLKMRSRIPTYAKREEYAGDEEKPEQEEGELPT